MILRFFLFFSCEEFQGFSFCICLFLMNFPLAYESHINIHCAEHSLLVSFHCWDLFSWEKCVIKACRWHSWAVFKPVLQSSLPLCADVGDKSGFGMLPFPCTFCWNPAGPSVPAEPQGDKRSRSSPENSCSDFCCCGWHQHHLELNMSSLLEPGAPRQSCCSSSFYFFFHLENVFVVFLFLFWFLIFFSGSRRVIYRIYGSFLFVLPNFQHSHWTDCRRIWKEDSKSFPWKGKTLPKWGAGLWSCRGAVGSWSHFGWKSPPGEAQPLTK